MSRTRTSSIRLLATALALALVVVFADSVVACPTCKENLASDPESANIVRGYFYSILFMLSMPPLILSGLSLYFYYEVRRARALQAKAAAEGHPGHDDALDGRLAQA